MWILYDLFIHLYEDAIRIAALFHPKARRWVRGRKGQWEKIQSAVGSLSPGAKRAGDRQSARTSPPESPSPGWRGGLWGEVIWFHCASLGEFEQGRPVIEEFRKRNPDWKILITFFSPSGYDVRKNYEGADWIFYLPMDTPFNAKRFIRLVRPKIAVFVKYEFWFRYLDRLSREKVPVFVISGIFRPEQHFFRWYGGWARKQLKKISGFFVQDQLSADLLKGIGIAGVTVSGDTRFDRVFAIAANAKEYPLVRKFAGDKPVFLAGSTWPADDILILQLIKETGHSVKYIIAPHELPASPGLLGRLPGLKAVAFSVMTEETAAGADVLIVDGIGYLSHLYCYSTVAYIGGGFGAGIHNILEAATFGKPVIFGPNYHKFREAVDLVALGGAFPVKDAGELSETAGKLLGDSDVRARAATSCRDYVERNVGATELIVGQLDSWTIKTEQF